MKKGLTEVVCVLDRSWSMTHIIKEAIGGFNKFLKEQKEEEGECNISIVLFNDGYDLIKDCISIEEADDLNDEDYYPRGSTALYDAIGKTINAVGERLMKTDEKDRPERVLFVILTDGEENNSKEFLKEDISSLIQQQEQKYKWEFIYLGANQDAMATGNGMGIRSQNTMDYVASPQGMSNAYLTISKSVTSFRSSGVTNLNNDS